MQQCAELAGQLVGKGYQIAAQFYLAHSLHARGDFAGALALVEQAETAVRNKSLWPNSARQMEGYRVLLWLRQGNVGAAIAWAAMYQRPANTYEPSLTPLDYDRFALARTFMAQGHWQQAHTALADLLRNAEASGQSYFVISALVLQALAFQLQGDLDQALTPLARALALAAPEGYVRIFVDEGAPMAALLREALARGIAPEYVARLLASFSSVEASASPSAMRSAPHAQLAEPLTGREMEVLHLLARGASNRDVAEQLIISIGTVKKHVNNILGKFGVHSRTQAIIRARELDIL